MTITLSILFFSLFSFSKNEFSVMSYNVENLFDSQHDAGKQDETYLPLGLKQSQTHKSKCKNLSNFKFRKDCYSLNWDDETVITKMKNVSQVILSVDQGHGPDVLILVEVENKSVLKTFNERFLANAKYKTIELIEGDDPRGIDVAILSRFPKAETARLLTLGLQDPRSGKKINTRGVLRVPLKISNAKVIAVFGVHLPSQGASTDVRRQAIESLSGIVNSEKRAWIVGGDFNITQKEDRESQLVSNLLSRIGLVSHIVGCGECLGTHFYKNKWSFLDILIFSHELKTNGIHLLADTIRVVNDRHFTSETRRPRRFNPKTGEGASDHFPIYSRLRF